MAASIYRRIRRSWNKIQHQLGGEAWHLIIYQSSLHWFFCNEQAHMGIKYSHFQYGP